MRFQPNRRRFLQSLALVVGAAAPWIGALLKSNGTVHPEARQLVRFWTHRNSAAFVGQHYLELVPSELDVDQLIRLIWSDRDHRTSLLSASSEDMRKILTAQQAADFEQQRVVSIHGWILSQTEARLCALASLVRL